jgi:hypothetical protein
MFLSLSLSLSLRRRTVHEPLQILPRAAGLGVSVLRAIPHPALKSDVAKEVQCEGVRSQCE